jgi:hypothetical protein
VLVLVLVLQGLVLVLLVLVLVLLVLLLLQGLLPLRLWPGAAALGAGVLRPAPPQALLGGLLQ